MIVWSTFEISKFCEHYSLAGVSHRFLLSSAKLALLELATTILSMEVMIEVVNNGHVDKKQKKKGLCDIRVCAKQVLWEC